ncbi:uncharacterized protein [Ptychodera flava]|uniref:uncharacterized protein isoform X2 n=1 Tax=Ptychodera flava TaxID=63121 RepID=UPI00396A9A8A
MLVIPLYAQCDFREIPEDGSAEEYTVEDLMAKDLPMSVLQVSDSDDPDQPWIEGVDAITLLKKVTYSSLVACLRDKPTRNRMEIPGFVELYGRQVQRARVEQRQLEWTPTVRTITAQQGKELESCELYDLIEKTPLLPPRPVQQTSAPDLNWATPSTKSTPHSLDQPTPALTQSEAAQPEAAPKSGFRKMLKSFKGLRTISISSSSEDKDKKKHKEGDVKLLDRFKRNIPKILTAGKSTKPGSNAGTPQSDSEDSVHDYVEADDVEVLGQPRRSTWAGDGLKGRGTLEESGSDDSAEYDGISDLTDSRETGKAFSRVGGQTVIAAPKRSLSEGDESRSHGDDEAIKEVRAELSALKQPTFKMATKVKDKRNIGYVGMYPDNKQKKSMVEVPPPDGDIYEFDVDDIEKLLTHLNCPEDVRQLFVSDKIDGKAMCQLTVPVLKEKYHLSRKPLFDVLDYIEITNSKNN